MMEYFANLNDMCVVNVMQCEGKQLRHVTVTAELEDSLSILSEGGYDRSLHIFWLSFSGMGLVFTKI